MRGRLGYWWRVLRLGARQVNAAFAVAGAIIIGLGIVGIAVPMVLHLSRWPVVLILAGVLVFVAAEGGYRVWRESEGKRKDAEAERDKALSDDAHEAHNRSVAAAGRLVYLVSALDTQVALWGAGGQDSVSKELADAYNQFDPAEVAAAGELTDQDLRSRVDLHSRLVNICLGAVGGFPENRPQVVRLLRGHAGSIIRALQAHQQGAPLPAYDPPPLEPPLDETALFAWRPAP